MKDNRVIKRYKLVKEEYLEAANKLLNNGNITTNKYINYLIKSSTLPSFPLYANFLEKII